MKRCEDLRPPGERQVEVRQDAHDHSSQRCHVVFDEAKARNRAGTEAHEQEDPSGAAAQQSSQLLPLRPIPDPVGEPDEEDGDTANHRRPNDRADIDGSVDAEEAHSCNEQRGPQDASPVL